MPAVSVVMPVHNAAATVARAVASIEAQTLTDWELLAVDDGSSDASREILLELADNDPRVRVLTIARSGIVAALNAGLAGAESPLIARMDADDESHPERLAEQAALLAAKRELGLVGCLVEFGGDRRVSAGYALHVDWLNSLVTPDAIALNRFVESPFAHPSVMFRRELVEEWGDYRDGDFPEDYEMWLRWLEAGVVMGKVPRPLLTWHDAPARLSRTDRRYDPEAFFRIKAEYVARWLKDRQVERDLRARSKRVEDAALHPRPIWIWGAGRPTRKRAAYLEAHGVAISSYIDIDAKKTGRKVGGVPVLAPKELPPAGEVFVLGYVSSRGARELIRADLKKRGYVEGQDFLMCA
ncbi:MAG TPA: glycosyltransferase [Candidatus Didemnitutus sp.]|nr:glycosyltransferase [Candidatus Didemnitutus sp.]